MDAVPTGKQSGGVERADECSLRRELAKPVAARLVGQVERTFAAERE